VSLVDPEEYNALRLVEKLIGAKIPREQITGFEITASPQRTGSHNTNK
jgi:hypothetical protein